MYKFDSRIRYSECDMDGNLTLLSLLNYFQDCSTFQSESLNIGVDYLKENHLVWLLCSWQIEVQRYPRLYEEVEIGTIPYKISGFLGFRNFYMKDANNVYIAKANSLWTLLDTDTMEPTHVRKEMVEGYAAGERLDMNYESHKINIPDDGKQMDAVEVKKHHIDTNQHVNNGQYVNIAMDYLPEKFLKDGIYRFRAEYKMQARLGDVLYPYVSNQGSKVIVAFLDEGGKEYASVEFSEKAQ